MEQKTNVEEGSYLYIIQNTPSLQPHFQRKRDQSPILIILGSLPIQPSRGMSTKCTVTIHYSSVTLTCTTTANPDIRWD
jgi:hypothetical protein